MHIVLVTSLSHDPVAKPYQRAENARRAMAKMLTDGGWPEAEAQAAALKGSPVMIADGGDDDQVCILERQFLD